jgi:uncharacterized membrane protein YeiH
VWRAMDTLIETSDLLTNTVVILGTVAWAVSGAMAAARHRLDWFGVVVLGVIVAVGGGTVRDLLLGLEVSWIQRPWPVFLAAGVALLTIPPARRWATAVDQWQIVLAADALGLGLFTVLGCDTALHAGTSSVVAVILGVMGGISGGVIRDLLLTRTPVVLTGEIYALAAIAGAVVDSSPADVRATSNRPAPRLVDTVSPHRPRRRWLISGRVRIGPVADSVR